MPRNVKSNKLEMKFHQKLILNRYIWQCFGINDGLAALTDEIKKPQYEEISDEGETGFSKLFKLSYPEAKRMVIDEKLSRYDLNIVACLKEINVWRSEKIRLKYFQWLSLLFIEFYLDKYFNDRKVFLEELNDFVYNFNISHSDYEFTNVSPYTEKDLNKVAFWNATGSGKTILMHINLLQYKHYISKIDNGAHFILLTPNEGLSAQHLEEFKTSKIRANIYDKNMNSFPGEITILENTKLAEKDGDKTISIKRFGNKNVLFVDEGHRGSSSGAMGKWQMLREKLCNNGFSFEYSATFGQAAESSKKEDKNLYDRYAKCIIFDYSYKYFYGDGFGKDYNILNLHNYGDTTTLQMYLTACLLSFYQQKKLFINCKDDFAVFNIENPLFVFVGARVTATTSEQEVSDIINILEFFKFFFENPAIAKENIKKLLIGNSGLLDDKNNDIFRVAFPYLIELHITENNIYTDILNTVFNAPNGGTLHIENLKGVAGEIQLRLGENDPFGVINVGDDAKLLNLCSEKGFNATNKTFKESLFLDITKPESKINLLIGAKKFSEGWNCWRVSIMGLMNVGKSEGSEIIQLFGRGIRLKGCNMSLKRSGIYIKSDNSVKPHKHIRLIETLNVFGIRAGYMQQFKEYLKREGVSENSQYVIIELPVIKNLPKTKLKTLRVKNGANFKKDAYKPILKKGAGNVTLDCYAKIQFESSGKLSTSEINKQTGNLTKVYHLLDVNLLWLELINYKKQKGYNNISIPRQAITDLLSDNSWYKLLISESDIRVEKYSDIVRIAKIALSLLEKYLAKFYYAEQNKWEANVVGYEAIEIDENEFPDKQIVVTTDKMLIEWLRDVKSQIETDKSKYTLIDKDKIFSPLTVFGFDKHLYNPLIYATKNKIDIVVSPVTLNDSEKEFVFALRDFINKNKGFEAEIYLLRNQSKKGVGFFEESGFYPDFILWLINGNKQYVTFIDPHGMRGVGISHEKVQLHKKIKTIQNKLAEETIILNSFILSPTKYADMSKDHRQEEWNENNVWFIEQSNYIDKIFGKIMSSN